MGNQATEMHREDEFAQTIAEFKPDTLQHTANAQTLQTRL